MKSGFKLKSPPVILRIGIALGVLLVLMYLFAWVFTGNTWFYSQKYAVNRLSKVLPILKDSHVKAYRDQNWCKVLIYDKGNYWFSSNPTTCVLDPGQPSPFIDVSNADFSKIKSTLLFTGVRIRWINVEYNEGGEISYAEFELNHPWPVYRRFLYSPFKALSNQDSECTNFYIGAGWYFTIEDWM